MKIHFDDIEIGMNINLPIIGDTPEERRHLVSSILGMVIRKESIKDSDQDKYLVEVLEIDHGAVIDVFDIDKMVPRPCERFSKVTYTSSTGVFEFFDPNDQEYLEKLRVQYLDYFKKKHTPLEVIKKKTKEQVLLLTKAIKKEIRFNELKEIIKSKIGECRPYNPKTTKYYKLENKYAELLHSKEIDIIKRTDMMETLNKELDKEINKFKK